jgi:hypothetical protein
VLLQLECPQPSQVRGVLLDVSDTGFRMAHTCMSLGSGQIVFFIHPFGHGKAQVVWNRVHGKAVETGLVLLR